MKKKKLQLFPRGGLRLYSNEILISCFSEKRGRATV